MRKRGGTPSRRDKHVTPAAISPPGAAQGRFVGGQQSGLAGCKPPLLFMCKASSVRHRGDARENHGAPLHDRVHLPTYLPVAHDLNVIFLDVLNRGCVRMASYVRSSNVHGI